MQRGSCVSAHAGLGAIPWYLEVCLSTSRLGTGRGPGMPGPSAGCCGGGPVPSSTLEAEGVVGRTSGLKSSRPSPRAAPSPAAEWVPGSVPFTCVLPGFWVGPFTTPHLIDDKQVPHQSVGSPTSLYISGWALMLPETLPACAFPAPRVGTAGLGDPHVPASTIGCQGSIAPRPWPCCAFLSSFPCLLPENRRYAPNS